MRKCIVTKFKYSTIDNATVLDSNDKFPICSRKFPKMTSKTLEIKQILPMKSFT